jgi:hypothetical protein
LSNPQPDPPNGRAILDVPFDAGASLTISNIELSGANNDPSAANPNGPSNGAGILFEIGNGSLTVLNSWIHDNEDGILTGGADAASTNGMYVTISNSQIDNNGAPPTSPSYGFDHNIYAGALTQLTVSNSYIHAALGGHEIKTRALKSVITNNTIEDGPTAQTSYSIDFSDGGVDMVTGNLIEKGPSSVNENIIDFGAEGTYLDSSLDIANNTFINDASNTTTMLNNWTQDLNGDTIPATITGNTLDGIAPSNLDNDIFPPPNDMASCNVFVPGPPPDTSPACSLPEPASIVVLLLAFLASGIARDMMVVALWRKGTRFFRSAA